MTIRPLVYNIRHKTYYSYGQTVSLSHHCAHLLPRDTAYQKCLSTHIRLAPDADFFEEQTDYFGNRTHLFTIQQNHNILIVETDSTVELTPPCPAGITTSIAWEDAAARIKTPQNNDEALAAEFLFPSPFVPHCSGITDYAATVFTQGKPAIDCVRELVGKIYNDFSYDPAATSIATPIADVLRQKRGVCQDFAHLIICALRSYGLPARYVSGYVLNRRIENTDAIEDSPNDIELVGGDASHAWVSVYIPEIGWIDADPTNNILPDKEHITIGWGRDFEDVSPIKGVMTGGGTHDVKVDVSVRLTDTPTSTAPDH